MTNESIPPSARAYLREVHEALTGIDRMTATEIIAGLREELSGLSIDESAARIETLGDPAFIAAEARAEARAESSAHRRTLQHEPIPRPLGVRSAGWFTALVVSLVAIGGVVVPILGAIVGYVMVWISPAWTRRDKWIALIVPPTAVIIVAIGAALLHFAAQPPQTADAVNPLVPWISVVVWPALVAVFPGLFVAGAWLIWRLAHLEADRSRSRNDAGDL